ncbi:MAG: hypothetical protein AAFX06_05665 [Planctomycetota bacterium]
MTVRIRLITSLLVLIGLVSGCGDANQPQGPEPGSVQAYLDENPDVAARVNEGDGVEEDGDSFDDE